MPADSKHFCESLRKWNELMRKRRNEMAEEDPDYKAYAEEFEEASRTIETAIDKSCLLDRMINCGEQPSQTPCPVHKGIWTGLHSGWPNTFMVVIKTKERVPVVESKQCRDWYDTGCRCYQHSCGCTTGWQPDEHCGCSSDEAVRMRLE